MTMSCVQGVGPFTTGHVGSLLGTRLRVDTSPSFLCPAYSNYRGSKPARKAVLPDLMPQRPTCQSASYERLAGKARRKLQAQRGHEGMSKQLGKGSQSDGDAALARGTQDLKSNQDWSRTAFKSVLGGFTGLALCTTLHAGHADALELDQQRVGTEITMDRSLEGQGVVKLEDMYAPGLGDTSLLLDARSLTSVEAIRPVSDERSGDSLNPVLDISSESGSGKKSDGSEAGSGERKRRASNGIAAAAAAVAGVSLVASGGTGTAATAATGATLGGTAAGALAGAAGGLAATSSVPVTHAVATVASLHAAEVVGAAVAGSALAGGSTVASLGSTAALTSAAVAVGAGAATVASGAAAAAAGVTSAAAGATSAVAGATSAAAGAASAAVGATSAALGATSAAVGATAAASATSAVLGATSAVAGTTSAVAAAMPVASSAVASAAVGASSAAVAATTSAVTSAVAASTAVPTSAVLAASLPVAVAGKAAIASSGTAISALPAVVAKSGASAAVTSATSAVTSASAAVTSASSAVTSAGAVCATAPARAAAHAATSAVLEGGAAAVAAAEAHSGAVLTQSALASALASSAHHFVEGGVAGAVGATVVCPIDVVKTRMQGQETKKGEKPKYANPADCFVQILKDEGPGAFFLGLIPQLLGVAPEKAMKLTVNDLLMSILESYIPGARLWALELFAGSGGGLAQVVFTNPMEMVKIRQQMQGPVDEGHKKKTALQIAYELGPSGLYQGSVATLLREIPSSAIFFGCYIVLKDSFPDQPFVAGCLAAAPAAFLCTPMDVVKTRMQMERKQGEATLGFWDTMQKIIKDEGPKALFNGGLTRVLRVSPQFGITLAVYELLNHW